MGIGSASSRSVNTSSQVPAQDAATGDPSADGADVWAAADATVQAFARRVRETLDADDAAIFLTRLQRRLPDLVPPLQRLYGRRMDRPFEDLMLSLLEDALSATAARPRQLRLLDHRREIDPEWFLDETMIGYVCYTDRFAGDLRGLRRHLHYLEELGVTYLHLMPLLQPRPAPNDGGYAVRDYRQVDSELGTMEDLEALAGDLRERGMSLCIDLVVNHTAREHEWAQRAIAGDQRYRDYYLSVENRRVAELYEQTLLETFPDMAPGNFTWVEELGRWVWTTFNSYQWDLDYANPDVFAEMARIMYFLANRGVEILRLDAVPFTWKRMGTISQNEPEAHLLLQAFRALVGVVAPAVAFKAEAIVPPGDLVPYLGAHRRLRRECELAYHNQLMVMLWSAVASRDVRLPTVALERMQQPPPGTGWVTYVRCHDDIGWAVTDENAGAVGLDAASHRRFLNDFYSGRFPGSFAAGVTFQENPVTGDARISGACAALDGIEQALDLGREDLLEAAISRHLLLHAVIYGWGGIPLLYMGDELGLRNDWSFLEDTQIAPDNRWVHRPRMDWAAAESRHTPGSLEARLFEGLQHLAQVRQRTPQVHGSGTVTPVWTGNERVLGWKRDHPRDGELLGLANVDDSAQTVDTRLLTACGITRPSERLQMTTGVRIIGPQVHLPALSVAWFTDDTAVL